MNNRPFEKAVKTGIPVSGTDDEYLVLVTPDTPGFEDIYEVLFKGELVYPGDEHFPLRFGHGDIRNLEEPGTQNKLVAALMTPERIRVATSFMLSAVPEINSKIDVSNVPCAVLPIRMAAPETIPDQNLEAINVLSPYSITGFNMKPILHLQTPDPYPELANTAAERIRNFAGHEIANRYVKASVSPNPTEKHLLQEHPELKDLPVERLGIQRSFANATAWRTADKQNIDRGFTYHVVDGGAYVGKFSQTNTSYVYGTKHAASEHRKSIRNGLIPVSSSVYWKLAEEERARCASYPTTVGIFRPTRHKVFIAGHPAFTHDPDADAPKSTLQ